MKEFTQYLKEKLSPHFFVFSILFVYIILICVCVKIGNLRLAKIVTEISLTILIFTLIFLDYENWKEERRRKKLFLKQ